jgi:hypothetical protein
MSSHKHQTPHLPNELAKKWSARIRHARRHWDTFHKRVKHNRSTVAGFNWHLDPTSKDFYGKRANLIHGTISAILPNIYARNPEISTTPLHGGTNLKLFCKTLETVTNRSLEKARLKNRAKSTLRSALTTSFGILKVTYQRNMVTDPIIDERINDAQDNLLAVEELLKDLEDPAQREEHEAKYAELMELLSSLSEQSEVVNSEGLVIDRILTENLLIDPSVCEFWDYTDADWMCQVVPMKRSQAEALYKVPLNNVKLYQTGATGQNAKGHRLASLGMGAVLPITDDQQIAVLEIWDKTTQRIYTMAEGADFWLREPYAPAKVGERWYPFFLLPYQVVDGQFVGPSLVDLTERLQDEHNHARDRFNKHRDLCIPGWVASAEINEKTIKKYKDSAFGDVIIFDTEGKTLNQVIQPKEHPKIDPIVYDTNGVRNDWEQVTGLQDAARSTIVKPKTATEASIMQRALSGRIGEFKDQVEDYLQEIAQYAAQILLQELSKEQVECFMGNHQVRTEKLDGKTKKTIIKSYDWPELSKDQVFEMVEMRIRAGTTGAPDKFEQQESWIKVLPFIEGLVLQIINLRQQGIEPEPLINLLRETLHRFDDRIDVELFIPSEIQAGKQGDVAEKSGIRLEPMLVKTIYRKPVTNQYLNEEEEVNEKHPHN